MLPLAEIGGGTSPVRKVQAGSSLSAFAGVISAAVVKRLPPWSLPKASHWLASPLTAVSVRAPPTGSNRAWA